MKRFFPLLLCLSLSIFAVARATKPTEISARNAKTAREVPTGQEADTKPLLQESNTEGELGSDDDDDMGDASGDEGEDTNNDDARDAVGDEGTGADDAGNDEGGGDAGDDDGGDEGD